MSPLPDDLRSKRPEAMADRVARAERIVRDNVERFGYGEAQWVSDAIQFQWGVWWEPETENHPPRLRIKLSDLQLVAFAAALQAHNEIVAAQYGIQPARKAKKKGGKRGKRNGS